MDAIIGIVISALMVALFAAAAKKGAKNAPPASEENFPFPFPFDQDGPDIAQEHMSDGRFVPAVADEIVVKKAGRTIYPTIKADKPMEINRNENTQTFDLRQAVIYEAILKPKYNDNIL